MRKTLFIFLLLQYIFPTHIYADGIVINNIKDTVYVFDNFDIIGTPINAQNGHSGLGWNGSWQAPAANGTVHASSSSLTYPSGVNLTATGRHAFSASPFGQGIIRDLLNPVMLGGDSTVFYVSFLTEKDATGNYRIDGLTSTGAAAGFAIGVTPDGRIKVNAGNTAGWGAVSTESEAGLIENGVTYFIVAQYQYENSQVNIRVSAFKEGDAVPSDDSFLTWDYSVTGGSLSTTLSSFRLAFTRGLGRIDEFRLGSTWASVVSMDISEPELAISTYRFPHFDWEDHPDQFADVARPVSYEIQIATDEQFSSVIDQDFIMLSRYVRNEPFDPGTYFWRVRSITYDGTVSAWQDTLSFTIEKPQVVITVPVPAGEEDYTFIVQDHVAQAEASAAEGNTVKIIFPPGDYFFGNSLSGAVINLGGVRNIEIEGTGATFHLSKRSQVLIKTEACENISISGINVNYARGIFRVQGHIVSIDNAQARRVTVSVEEGSPDFDASSAPNNDIFILLHPTIDGRLKDKASHFYRMEDYSKNEDGTYSITLQSGGNFSSWEVGDRYVFHFRGGSPQVVNYENSRYVTAHSLTTNGWGNMGFVSVKGSHFNILNCKTILQEGDWMMGNADGVHIREHVVGPWIEGTDILATGDDGVALYARPTSIITAKPDGNEKTALCAAEFFNLERGDEVSFFQPTGGRILLETTVTNVRESGEGFLVSFADVLPDDIITGSSLVDVTQIWNRSRSCGDFVIRNCQFINNRRYGLVFRSKRGVIENNLILGASSRAIIFRNETAVPNGLYASEIIVSNNRIEDSAFDGTGMQAPISFGFEGRGSPTVQSIGPRNILIENNVIKDCPSPEIHLYGIQHVVIRNNIVINSAGETQNAVYTDGRSGDIAYSMTIHPEADAFVQGGLESDSNFGSALVLTCKEDADEGNTRRSYLRFNLSALTGLPIDSVVLSLRVDSVVAPGDNLSVWFVSDDAWNESEITWNNRPEKGHKLNSKAIDAGAGDRIELNLTDQVLNELAGNKQLSLVLLSGQHTLVQFSSREADLEHRPRLMVALKKTASPLLHTIQATAGNNGSINPAGNVTVFDGTSETFSFRANAGYEIDHVLVNGSSVGAVNRYTFYNVTANRSIHVEFRKIEGASLITPEADAYVHGGSFANQNFGTSDKLIVKTSINPTYTRMSYLRFDLSEIEKTLTSAKLRLKLASIDGNPTRHEVSFVSDDSWGETTINWLNKPDAGAVLYSQTTPAINDWVEFDVTSQAETERIGDGKISLLIRDVTDSEVMSTYFSREAGEESRPHLLIVEADDDDTGVTLNDPHGFITYPNPASTLLNVELEHLGKFDVSLFDILGILVFSKKEAGNKLIIPVNHLSNGVYILKVTNEQESYVEKILIDQP